MADPFGDVSAGISGPGNRHFAIVPSDTVDLTIRPRAIICIVEGNAKCRDDVGTDITYPMLAGQYLLLRAVRVLATGTTASLVGLY